MSLQLSGAKVIVTAGAAGIGRAIVDRFLAEGALVATCDIDEAALAGFIGTAIARLGGSDCLVNNAGSAVPTAAIQEVDLADWHRPLDVVLTSQFITISQAVAALHDSANPSIINMLLVAGRKLADCLEGFGDHQCGAVLARRQRRRVRLRMVDARTKRLLPSRELIHKINILNGTGSLLAAHAIAQEDHLLRLTFVVKSASGCRTISALPVPPTRIWNSRTTRRSCSLPPSADRNCRRTNSFCRAVRPWRPPPPAGRISGRALRPR